MICERNCPYLSPSTLTNPAHSFLQTQHRRSRSAWAKSAAIRVESRSLIWSHSQCSALSTLPSTTHLSRVDVPSEGREEGGAVSEERTWKPREREERLLLLFLRGLGGMGAGLAPLPQTACSAVSLAAPEEGEQPREVRNCGAGRTA